jgi:hypothetical protein
MAQGAAVNPRHALLLYAIIALAASGCDDAFSPKGPLAETPILYCVLEVRPIQERYVITATLSSVYDAPGYTPGTNTDDPTIGRAAISLLVGRSSVYPLAETLIRRPTESPYGDCWHVYRATQVQIRTRDTLRLSALLPDGRQLSAMTVVPTYRPVSTFPLYPRGVTTRLNSLYFGSAWVINWDDLAHEDHLFFPRLQLIYEVSTDSGTIGGGRDVPLRLVPTGSGALPVYPQVTSTRELAFEFAAIDATMEAIADGEPDKSRYRVSGFVFDLVELDFPLSRYYASINGSLDQVSIRLEESVFTNIANGQGVFGTSMANSRSWEVESDYAAEFGYRTAP